MNRKYQCTECGGRWTSPFAPMFCNGTKGCRSKSFVEVDDTEGDPIRIATPVSANPFLKPQPVAPPVATPERMLVESPAPVAAPVQPAEIKPEEPVSAPVERAAPASVSRTKNLLWEFRALDDGRPARFCPVLDGENRLFVSVSNILAMFEPDALATGKPTWTKSFGGIVRHPVLGPDGDIRIHASDGRLYTVAPNGEESAAPVDVGTPPGGATPTVDQDGTVWLQSSSGALTKIEPVDNVGDIPRKPFFRTRQRLDCTGLSIDSVFYVGGESGSVLAIDLTGERGVNRWENNDRVRTGWCVNSALARAGSTLIVSSRDDILYGFSTDGERLWETPMPGQMLGSPVVDGTGTVFIGLGVHRRGGNIGFLACVDGRTHRIRWEMPTSAPVESTPVIGVDGTVYFGDNDGNLFGVDGHGNVRWSDKVDAAVRSPGILIGEGRLAFGLDDGAFAVFSCSSPAIAPDGWPKFRKTFSQNGTEHY